MCLESLQVPSALELGGLCVRRSGPALAPPCRGEGWGLRIEHWLPGQAPRGAQSLRCSGNPAVRLREKGLVMEAER